MNPDYGEFSWPSWLSFDGGFGPKFQASKLYGAGQKVGGWFGDNPDASQFIVGAGTAIAGGIQQKRAMEQQAALQAQLAAQQMQIEEARAARTQQLLMIGIPVIALTIGAIAWSRREQ